MVAILATVVAAAALVYAQTDTEDIAPSWPHDYPGKPAGDFSPAWQDYFRVSDPLPNVTFGLGRNWAGNININGAPANDTLFFWAFEKEEGSLTADAGQNQDAPWAIFLDGDYFGQVGGSSMFSLLYSNGPMRMNSELGMSPTEFSWSTLADFIWLDQPVSSGFSTASADGLANDADQASAHLWGFVENFVKVFPSLATRPLFLIGRNGGGKLVPYIAKSYFALSNPPAKLAKIVMADPVLAEPGVFAASAINIIQTYPQLIGYDTAVYSYFAEQAHLCGYDLNLSYPQQGGKMPDMSIIKLRDDTLAKRVEHLQNAAKRARSPEYQQSRRELHDAWKRDLTGRPNGTIDPWYGCSLWYELILYVANFSAPWQNDPLRNVVPLNLNLLEASSAIYPYPPWNGSLFLNDDRTRTALHAPTSKDWDVSTSPPERLWQPPSPAWMFDDLAANASKHDVSVVIYNSNENIWYSHWPNEVVIQNTSFGGIQGFSRKPSTPWSNDDGSLGGIVHQERNWTYGLILSGTVGGPAAYPFLREFVFGTNTTGLVTSADSVAQGGEDVRLNASAVPAPDGIYVGSASTASTFLAPSASIAAWKSFIGTAASITPIASSGVSPKQNGETKTNVAGLLVGLSLLFELMVLL